jgi:hypothetical protein
MSETLLNVSSKSSNDVGILIVIFLLSFCVSKSKLLPVDIRYSSMSCGNSIFLKLNAVVESGVDENIFLSNSFESRELPTSVALILNKFTSIN